MKKRLLCLLISLSIAAPLAIFPALGVESDLPVLPNEPDPVVVQKDAPIPEELPAALKEVPNNVCPVPKTEDLRLLMPQDSGFSLFSARAVEQAVAVEISADGKVAGTIRFTLDSSNHTALLIGSDPGIDGMLVVPSSISCEDTEYTVTAIGDSAFAGQAELTQLWLPHTVSSIGYEAFMNCEQLLAVGTYDDEGTADPYALPQQVSFIGGRAFRGCTRLGG